VGLDSLKSINLTNGYPNNKNNKNKKKNNSKVKSKPLELFELAGKNSQNYPLFLRKNFFFIILQNIRVISKVM
jgi:hypothetical protein